MATIKEITEILNKVTDLNDSIFTELEQDERVGVQRAILKRQKELEAELAEEERLENLLTYEKELYRQGVQVIAGIDEVGRGPLAGPVVAAAVILPVGCKIPGLNDSKQIPKQKHQAVFEAVMNQALEVSIGVRDNHAIDRLNIYEATKEAMLEALDGLEQQPQHLLVDAMTLDRKIPQNSLIKGDAKSMSIAAASIVAKVVRDQMMSSYDQLYPGYDFATNVGYGTANHLAGLHELGVTPIHRQSFEPIKSMISDK